jgi:hypothetical protein
MSDSYITVKNDQITSYIGPDATHLFQARTLVISLKALQKGFTLTRGATPTRMLALASTFTDKKYKRGEYDRAINDVQIWINTMECALPIIVENDK